ncbi:MAG: hypoxanthine phosphoribosyltransferase [Deltaproteobacteria bacterium]|nr:hypoxanthine phosphoribosyltransferase [Deltaproteobacteria bacterium]
MPNAKRDPFASIDRLRPLISEEEIRIRTRELGAKISADYKGSDLLLVSVLKGGFVFLADLVRTIDIPLELDFMRVRSYGARSESSGVVEITADLTGPVEGKRVLFVEDIVDTGLTMTYLMRNIKTRHPADVKLCALLYKPERKLVDVPIDYLGFTIPNQFVVGYGLDYAEKHRNLPYIATLDDEPPG